MHKYLLGFLLSFSFLISSPAQGTAIRQDTLSLLDAVSARRFPDRWYGLTWLNEDAFVFTENNQSIQVWEGGEISEYLTGEDLVPEGTDVSPMVNGLRWETPSTVSYVRQNMLCRYEVGGEVKVLFHWPEEASNLERGPSHQVAYTLDGNIFVTGEQMDQPLQITEDACETIVYGEAAHRSEFGITKGFFWSPTGDKLAFYRIDQSEIPAYPLINQQEVPAKTEHIYYPMAGEASQQVTIGVVDIESGEVVYLNTGEPADHYLTNITWSPSGMGIFVTEVNRDQNHLWLNHYHVVDGERIATLFEETDEEYVEPEHGLFFFPGSNEEFLWFSERDGWQHLYHYTVEGQLVMQVTNGAFDVTGFEGFLPKYQSILISSREESPLQSHLYRVALSSGKSHRLSKDPGVHTGIPSPSGSVILDAWSSSTLPWSIKLIDSRKGKLKEELHLSEDPLKDVQIGEMEIVSLAATDGTPLYGRVIKPVGFDPEKQYPAIVYVYGGPHVQLIENKWLGGASMFLYYLAQKGYVVWTVDNRGTPHRGIDFEQSTFRRLGTVELEDQITGITYLKSLPYVDADRVGIHGWSFGGFMTTSLMTREPGTCQVGVAGGPVIDWRMYEVMYTERYMDTPQENEEGYEETSLLNYADQLEGKLLIIHGQQDDVVLPQHTFRYIRKCVELAKQVDYFPYPTHPHNVRGRDRMHLLEKISLYFDTHL